MVNLPLSVTPAVAVVNWPVLELSELNGTKRGVLGVGDANPLPMHTTLKVGAAAQSVPRAARSITTIAIETDPCIPALLELTD